MQKDTMLYVSLIFVVVSVLYMWHIIDKGMNNTVREQFFADDINYCVIKTDRGDEQVGKNNLNGYTVPENRDICAFDFMGGDAMNCSISNQFLYDPSIVLNIKPSSVASKNPSFKRCEIQFKSNPDSVKLKAYMNKISLLLAVTTPATMMPPPITTTIAPRTTAAPPTVTVPTPPNTNILDPIRDIIGAPSVIFDTPTAAPVTTATRSPTTFPLATTTLAPATTTLAPATTTLAPATTTQAPATTTTFSPATTTLAPATTTLAPATTTLAPATTTLAPAMTTSTYRPLNEATLATVIETIRPSTTPTRAPISFATSRPAMTLPPTMTNPNPSMTKPPTTKVNTTTTKPPRGSMVSTPSTRVTIVTAPPIMQSPGTNSAFNLNIINKSGSGKGSDSKKKGNSGDYGDDEWEEYEEFAPWTGGGCGGGCGGGGCCSSSSSSSSSGSSSGSSSDSDSDEYTWEGGMDMPPVVLIDDQTWGWQDQQPPLETFAPTPSTTLAPDTTKTNTAIVPAPTPTNAISPTSPDYTTEVPLVPSDRTNWNYSLANGKLNLNGKPLNLNGVNWYGFENKEMMPQMLWSFPMEAYFELLEEKKFNAIRVPISAEFMLFLEDPEVCVGNQGKAKIAEQGKLVGDADIDGKSPAAAYDKFLRLAYKYNMLVMIDLHTFLHSDYRPGVNRLNNHLSNKSYEYKSDEKNGIKKQAVDFSLSKIADLWKNHAKWLLKYPHVFGADIKNEPHDVPWTAWANAVETIGNAIHEVNPHIFIIVEGNDDQKPDPGTDASKTPPCWGASLGGVRKRPIILTKTDKVIYSPHQYGYAVDGSGMSKEEDWETNWGYLKTTNKLPLMMGEWSMSNKPDRKADDKVFHENLLAYMAKLDVESFFFSINNSSSDTVGLVGTAGSDYQPTMYHINKLIKVDSDNKPPSTMTKPEVDPYVMDMIKILMDAHPPTDLAQFFPKAA